MIYEIPENTQPWEAVALVSIVQALRKVEPTASILMDACSVDVRAILSLAGVGVNSSDHTDKTLSLLEAYQQTAKAEKFYGDVVLETNGLPPVEVHAPRFPFVAQTQERRGIVICPFAFRAEFTVKDAIWKGVHRHLESYGEPVYIVGEKDQRLGVVPAFEHEMLCDVPMVDKLYALAGAKLVVGVANAYTWASAAFDTHRMLLHPDTIRNDRWYPPMDNDKTKWLLTAAETLTLPVVLTGVRQMMRTI